MGWHKQQVGHHNDNKNTMKTKRTKQTPTSTATSTQPKEAGTPQSSAPQPSVPNIAEPNEQKSAGPCSNVPLSTEKKRFEVRYELLFSETRPPNFVQSSPRHTITLASSKTATNNLHKGCAKESGTVAASCSCPTQSLRQSCLSPVRS
jgi:hypothetical protein